MIKNKVRNFLYEKKSLRKFTKFTKIYEVRLRKININMKNPEFVEGQIYHIYNRGVEKRKIFLDDSDYFRFIHNLFEFNDTEPALNLYYKLPHYQSYEVSLRKIKAERKPRELLVEILIFSLMPNHFHLLVKQKLKNGITNFMRKLGTGYTNYFNKKYNRVGVLFQSAFKAVLINQDSHFIHLPFYIHSNALDLIAPEWREKEIKNVKKAISFLENYRWSSYLDYAGKANFPSVTQREMFLKYYNGPENYKKSMQQWLKEISFKEIEDLILE